MLEIFDRLNTLPVKYKVVFAVYNIGFVVGFGGMLDDINTTIADVIGLAIIYVMILYTVCLFYNK